MLTDNIRKTFLDFFAKREHKVLDSSGLLVQNQDLLFTVAGMVWQIDNFKNPSKAPADCAVVCQPCLRCRGRNNDTSNVGKTPIHLSFFEMLDSYSFGKYSRELAILYAWELLADVFYLDPKRIVVTVHKKDTEAFNWWSKIAKLPSQNIIKCCDESNIWSSGANGLLGLCSEIFYYTKGKVPANVSPKDLNGDSWIEIWNLVFISHQNTSNGRVLLPNRNLVDTGMGLERIAAVIQGVFDVFETDALAPILREVADVVKCSDFSNPMLRIITDHLRAVTILIKDGALPSNEKHGYVVRYFIRQALLRGNLLGKKEPFLAGLVQFVAKSMAKSYPKLIDRQHFIERVVADEEDQYIKTISGAMRTFELQVENISDGGEIPGEVLFKLHDTYGFPIDLAEVLAKEQGLRLDYAGYRSMMAMQQERSRNLNRVKDKDFSPFRNDSFSTEFVGYERQNWSIYAMVLAISKIDGEGCENQVSKICAGETGVIVLDRTSFYCESGGQVCDIGFLTSSEGTFEVSKVKQHGNMVLHYGVMANGEISLRGKISARVDAANRQNTCSNHTVVHILQAALREMVSESITQAGSYVCPDYFRFDFTYGRDFVPDVLTLLENEINSQVRQNYPIITQELSLEEAYARGCPKNEHSSMKLANLEKARAIIIGDEENPVSIELCGGTHVQQTGEIGLFKIISSVVIAHSVRRITGVTGQKAWHHFSKLSTEVCRCQKLMKSTSGDISADVDCLMKNIAKCRRENEILVSKLVYREALALVEEREEVFANGGGLITSFSTTKGDLSYLRSLAKRILELLNANQTIVALLAPNGESDKSMNLVIASNAAELATTQECLDYLRSFIKISGGGNSELAQGKIVEDYSNFFHAPLESLRRHLFELLNKGKR